MNDLDKFEGMNPPEFDLISRKIHDLLRDHARFIELVNSLSGFLPEYELLMEYLQASFLRSLLVDISHSPHFGAAAADHLYIH